MPMHECIHLLRTLVQHNTVNPTGDDVALARFLEQQLRNLKPDAIHLVTDIPRGQGFTAYVFARWGTPSLLLNAHIDTVPANAGWAHDPWTLHDDGTQLSGLGACDTKGAIAAILSALQHTQPNNIGVLFSGDEEGGCRSMNAFIQSEHMQHIRQAIVCEPTQTQLGVKHRGILALRFHVVGNGGHSSQADHKPAPLAELARLATAFYEYGQTQRNIGPQGFEGICLNIAELSGGIAFNVIPNDATLSVSLRPPPGTRNETYVNTLQRIAKEICPKATCTIHVNQPAFDAQPSDLLLNRFPQPRPECVALPYWTEAALLCDAGIEAVVFGPGHVAQAHAPNEFVTHQQLRYVRDTFMGVIGGTR